MSININTSNRPSLELLAVRLTLEMMSAGFFVGGGICAGAALGPVGSAGGALFGGISYVALSGTRICKKIFNLDDHGTSLVAKVAAFAIELFVMTGSGMLALTLAGFTITLGSAAALTITSLIFAVALKSVLETCCCCDFEAQAERLERKNLPILFA